MRMRTGYSVESQVTGNDTVGGLQFEITRLYRSLKGNDGSRPKEARFTIKLGDVIECHREYVGGGGGRMPTYREPQMNLAAGGLIKQGVVELPQRYYQKTNTIAFNVQILNSATFQQVTGNPPPPSPVSAETYAKSGYPFFSGFEEPINIAGDFVAVRSISQLNGDADPPLQFPLVDAKTGVSLASGTVGFLNPDGPKKEFKFT
ncbi:uncharacterized protein NECHADRAFT_77326 [Fusarium vanettenii 77-13-4]|uniref:Uncharacterized protein n=1 Tax=Fusarium vanettenii (strain ATCC MYA-4622 / CBS 123669 / FGSC 9596 / NRRL 45880 / 77-13-4) TaxID=660122 RepID=C7YKX3_FUSV7|nr:uncharacterized protein NECHADRAFT_77326 [Fusarium vanettenii 77-13-4]EEU46693.1 hypothetical protein NECHADRAFT_77326 [Fusarium vanettenii 77-13-4]